MFKKVLSLFLTIALMCSLTVGCGSNDNKKVDNPATEEETVQNDKKTDEEKDAKVTDVKEENVEEQDSNKNALDTNYKVKFAEAVAQTDSSDFKALVKMIKEETGLDVEVIPIPGAGQDYNNKINISLMSGDKIDIVKTNNATAYNWMKAKLLMPLNDVAKEQGEDLDELFGKNTIKYDGQHYSIPKTKDQWITLYNKKIFDDANVDYPDPDNWTWDEYIATAKKLTDTDKGIYGSYMLDYDCYNYMLAQQKGISSYKEDGTSNADDPGFKESLKFFYDLGNVHKIQPDFLTFKSEKLQWDDFARGKYGMFVCGSWSACLVNDPENYPRDWKFGILPMPSVDLNNRTALSIIGGFGVPVTTDHPNEAFAAALAMGKNYYKISNGDLPARITSLSQEEKDSWASEVVNKTFNNEITKDEYLNAFEGVTPVSEKIIGKGAAAIANAFLTEGEAYGVGQKTLDEAIENIKKKCDEGIKADE